MSRGWPLGPSTGQVSHHRPNPAGGPTMIRGESNQEAETPWPFIKACEDKFGPLGWDLAASKENAKVGFDHYWSEVDNSLARKWHELGIKELFWLNPPYAQITPWARKCAEEVQLGARILLLVPASVGANWYWDWVVPYADVYSIGRLVFDNCYDRQGRLITTAYPKDLILCRYDWSTKYVTGRGNGEAIIHRWRWQ